MGTFYSIRSEFRVKADVKSQELDQAIEMRIRRLLDPDGMCEVRERGAGLYIVLQSSGFKSYSKADSLDEAWKSLIKDYADLSWHPIEVILGGDDYKSGPRVWLIGTRRSVLEERLRRVRKQINDLRHQEKRLMEGLKDAAGGFFAESS